jgi:hypothetical protein
VALVRDAVSPHLPLFDLEGWEPHEAARRHQNASQQIEEGEVQAISEFVEQAQVAAQIAQVLYMAGWVCRVWGSCFSVSMPGVPDCK